MSLGTLPGCVQREFEDDLKRGRLEHVFFACAVKPSTRNAWLLLAVNAAD
jgi:hypothetical protein